MTIEAVAGIAFEVVLSPYVPGRAAALRIEVFDPTDGTVLIASSASGITEPIAETYRADRTVTLEGAGRIVRWRDTTGGGAGEIVGEDVLDVAAAPPVVSPATPPATAPGGGVTLELVAVRQATASLMAYRLRIGGFTSGRGGAETEDFTTTTTPTLARANEVVTRNAALVSDDFPAANVGDEPELRTIAALRSAIELEASAPNMDPERIRVWREQLREYVQRVSGGSGGDEGAPGPGEPGFRVLAPVWYFGPREADRAPGSEVAWDPSRTRRRW